MPISTPNLFVLSNRFLICLLCTVYILVLDSADLLAQEPARIETPSPQVETPAGWQTAIEGLEKQGISAEGFKEALELLKTPTDLPEADVHVHAVIEKGVWEVAIDSRKTYEQEKTPRTTLILPVGQMIAFSMTSYDIIYELEAPQIGLKIDLVPGRITSSHVSFSRIGQYEINCPKTCGRTTAKLILDVRSVAEFEALRGTSRKTAN